MFFILSIFSYYSNEIERTRLLTSDAYRLREEDIVSHGIKAKKSYE